MKLPKRYHTFTVGDTEYKARLNRRAIKKLEERTKMSITEFMSQEEGDVMDLFDTVVWASIQPFVSEMEGGKFTINDASDLFDELVDEGKNIDEIMEIVNDIMMASGFGSDEEVEVDTKN